MLPRRNGVPIKEPQVYQVANEPQIRDLVSKHFLSHLAV